VNFILDRIKRARSVDSDVDLARLLGVRQNVVANWRSRGTLDYGLVVESCRDLDLNWILAPVPDSDSADPKAHEQSPSYYLANIERRLKWFAGEYGTMEEVARDLGVERTVLASMMDGVKPIDLPLLLRLEAIGCNTTWLLSGTGKPFARRVGRQRVTRVRVKSQRKSLK
jgi:hypothetical protein